MAAFVDFIYMGVQYDEMRIEKKLQIHSMFLDLLVIVDSFIILLSVVKPNLFGSVVCLPF